MPHRRIPRTRFDGLPAIAAWIDEWIDLGSRVTSWRIHSFIYENRKAAIEWRFTCTHLQAHHDILGASVFTFPINNQISSIAEYRQSAKGPSRAFAASC